jgi:hypothetical protein
MTYIDPNPGTQPPVIAEPPRKRHPLRKWLLIATAVFAAILAAGATVSALTPAGAQKGTGPATPAAAAQPSTPGAIDECTSGGGTWNGSSCDYTTPAPAQAGPDMLTAGQAETLGDDSDATVGTITVGSVRVTTRPADPEFGSAPANGYYLIARVQAAADPAYADGFSIYTGDFYALAAGEHYDEGNGNAYEALRDPDTELSYSTLAAGETAHGTLVFDLPGRHGRIVYAPNSDGQPVAEWSY